MATCDEVLEVIEKLAGTKEVGTNQIIVNKKYGMNGYAYCGTTIRYAFDMAGSKLLSGCVNPAYVPTLKSFCAGQGWKVATPKRGCIFAYSDQHVGLVDEVYGNYIITIEGNSIVRATLEAAKSGTADTGDFEGIGFKKRSWSAANYTFYMPAYEGTSTVAPKKGTITLAMPYIGADYTYEVASCKALQAILSGLGYKGADGKELDIDGECGDNTDYAIKAYQAKNGLTADGEFGALSWKKALKG